MKRREFIALIGVAAAWSGSAWGQAKVPRIVYLWLGPAGSDDSTREGLLTGLRELGYQEGRNIVVAYRYAEGKEERLTELAAAAVAEQPDLIVTPGTVVTRAVKRLTATVPILSVSGDPVGSGFIASLARPGGNITGFTIQVGPELAEKWLEMILEIVPSARRIAWLVNVLNPVGRAELVRMRAAADRLGGNITLDEYPIREAADLPPAFEAILRAGADALIVANDPLMSSKRAAIAAFATEHRIPAISGGRDFVEAGMLIAYGTSIFDICRRAASYIDRILKGAKPADLPVQQPTKFELVVNLKTARALGLTVPTSILARADEVIE